MIAAAAAIAILVVVTFGLLGAYVCAFYLRLRSLDDGPSLEGGS